MFPYPSGRIHMGHVRNYTMGDVLARYQKMRGFEVLHPMGWDAFGMPAENAAMEKGVHPGGWTRANIAQMKAQLQRIGFALDWTREFATCDPEYYGHEQALFVDLYEAGLVYRKESTVNWDPVDMTVLANEQVIDGKGWRSGAEVEKRKLNQWFLKITDFADDLMEGLSSLEDWPEKVRLMQENWIGKSQGLEFSFDLSAGDKLPVYTTRPDTIFGASFVAVAADHPIAQSLADDPEVAAFIEQCKRGGTKAAEVETAEKLGYRTAITARHPFTGEPLPLFIANFVLHLLWSPLFFKLRRPDWALYENIFLWLSVAGLLIVLPRVSGSNFSGLLNLPYFVWVSFAFVLNWKIVKLNAPFGAEPTAS
jgi:leucyl-tRNA synthetase